MLAQKKPSKKTIVKIIGLLILLAAVGFFFFGPGPDKSFFLNAGGPSPEDPRARQQ